MQFGHKLRQIGFVVGLFVLLLVGHRFGMRSSPADSVKPHPSLLPDGHKQPGSLSVAESFVDGPNSTEPLTPAVNSSISAMTTQAAPVPFDAAGALPIPLGDPSDPHVVALNQIVRGENRSSSKPAVRSDRGATKGESRPQKITPDDALPLIDGSIADELHSLFNEEWPDATQEERDIWTSQLRGIPPETIRELLRLRQNHSVVPPQRIVPRMPLTAEPVPPESLLANPNVGTAPRHGLADFDRAFDVLRMAQAAMLQNLLNAKTPGYKARIVSYADFIPLNIFTASPRRRDDAEHHGRDLSLNQYLDVRPGTLRETKRSLDVAIDGAGWFQITAEGEHFYTRNGRWSLTGSRTVALWVGGTAYLIEPQIVVPENVGGIVITPSGDVFSTTSLQKRRQSIPDDAVPIGKIALYGFFDESALVAVAPSVYAATSSSGNPIELPSEECAMRHGFLEEANVDVAQGLRECEQLQQLQQMLYDLINDSPSQTFSAHVDQN